MQDERAQKTSTVHNYKSRLRKPEARGTSSLLGETTRIVTSTSSPIRNCRRWSLSLLFPDCNDVDNAPQPDSKPLDVHCAYEAPSSVRPSAPSHLLQEGELPCTPFKVNRRRDVAAAVRLRLKRHDQPSLLNCIDQVPDVSHGIAKVISRCQEHYRLQEATSRLLETCAMSRQSIVPCTIYSDADFGEQELHSRHLWSLLPRLQFEIKNLRFLRIRGLQASGPMVVKAVTQQLLDLIHGCPCLERLDLNTEICHVPTDVLQAQLNSRVAMRREKEARRNEEAIQRTEMSPQHQLQNMMDFFYWENSNRIAIMTLQVHAITVAVKAWKRETRLLPKEMRETFLLDIHKKERWQLEEEAASSMEKLMEAQTRFRYGIEQHFLCSMEEEARTVIVWSYRRLMEKTQGTAKIEYRDTHERLCQRLTDQRRQRMAIAREMNRCALKVRGQEQGLRWFFLVRKKCLERRHTTEKTAQLYAPDEEKRGMEMKQPDRSAAEQMEQHDH